MEYSKSCPLNRLSWYKIDSVNFLSWRIISKSEKVIEATLQLPNELDDNGSW